MNINQDDLLQEKLEELEAGAALDQIFSSLSPGETQLVDELQVAKLLREHPHPQPSSTAFASGKEKLLLLSKHAQATKTPANGSKNRTRWLLPVFAVTSLAILFICSVLFGAGIWANNRIKANSVKILAVNGIVESQKIGQSSTGQTMKIGSRLYAGEQLHTSVNSSVLLEFADGSRALVGPETQIVFDEIKKKSGGLISIKMTQLSGSSSHKVVPFGAKSNVYQVHTPGGVASVRGTEFAVNVDQYGATALSVDKGAVNVRGTSQNVFVEAGQKTTLALGDEPEQPAYQFAIQGTLNEKNESLWVISGKMIQVAATTLISGTPEIGEKVFVEGRILADGTWLADQIVEVTGDSISTYTGVVEAMSDSSWIISGQVVHVNEGTLVSEDIELNDPVKVLFQIQDDGSWLALSIISLVDKGTEPVPTQEPDPTLTPDPNAMPSLSFEPDELTAFSCENQSSLEGKLSNTSSEPKDVARSVQLGYEVISGLEWIDQVMVVPSYWDEIAHAESVSFAVKLLFKPDWQAAPSGTEVKVRVFVASELNRPDHLNGRVTATFVRNCDGTPVPTWSPTPDLTLTPTPTLDITPTPTPLVSPTPQATTCTGANPHPTGTTLALRYGVSYEEIMGWFCQGFGFGEIDLAYSLSLQSGTPVTEIFNLRKSGMGWGEIKKLLLPDKKGGPPGSQPGGPPSGGSGKPPGGPPNKKP
jgi:hypothetical protein